MWASLASKFLSQKFWQTKTGIEFMDLAMLWWLYEGLMKGVSRPAARCLLGAVQSDFRVADWRGVN